MTLLYIIAERGATKETLTINLNTNSRSLLYLYPLNALFTYSSRDFRNPRAYTIIQLLKPRTRYVESGPRSVDVLFGEQREPLPSSC